LSEQRRTAGESEALKHSNEGAPTKQISRKENVSNFS
jgi:hypothetical protein